LFLGIKPETAILEQSALQSIVTTSSSRRQHYHQ